MGRWESLFELYPTPDSTKIEYVSRELQGKVAASWHGLRTTGKLPDTWTEFVTIFKGQFLQPPSRTEAAQTVMNLSSWKFSSLEDYVHHVKTQIQKSGLDRDNWYLACFVNGTPIRTIIG